MAGEWIKMEIGLREKPEVMRLAKILKVDRCSVVGMLFCFWVWTDKNTVDGVVDGVEASDVDEVVSVPGFGSALETVGWLTVDKEKTRIVVPKFERHNGESAKKRALKNERQARWRANSASTCASTETSTSAPTSASTREEKRREEALTPLSPPARKAGANGEHRARKKPATRAPDSFEITEPMWAWAQEQGVQHERIESETKKFLDHHKAKDSLFSDWSAAWRKWMRNVVDFAARAH